MKIVQANVKPTNPDETMVDFNRLYIIGFRIVIQWELYGESLGGFTIVGFLPSNSDYNSDSNSDIIH